MSFPAAPPTAPPAFTPPPRAGNGLAVGALVVGIVAFLVGWVPVLGLVGGIGALVLGVLALRRAGGRGAAIVGMVLGSLAALTSLVTTILMIVTLAAGGSGSTTAARAVAAPAPSGAAAAVPAEEETAAPPAEATPAPTVEATKPEPSAAKPKAGAAYGGYPTAEARFVKIVDAAGSDYADTTNELKGAKVLANRDADACRVTSGRAKSWVGTIHDVGATGDGDGYVEIEIAPNIVVETWNNSFSDAFDDTLIPASAGFYDRLADMEEGDEVVFSGRFVASDDSCIDTANLTKTFNAADPDFLFHFTNIRAQ